MNYLYKELKKVYEKKEKENELWNLNFGEIAKEFEISPSTARNHFYNFLHYEMNIPIEKLPKFKKFKKI